MVEDRISATKVARRSRAFTANFPLLFGGLVLLVMIWTGLAYHLQQTREGETVQARRDVTNLSVALAEQVSRLVEETDQILRLMQENYARDPERFDLREWVTQAVALRPVANQIAIFDEHGDLVSSQTGAMPGEKINIADRDQFTFLAEHPAAGLYVGRTNVGRIRHVRVFTLTRRLVVSQFEILRS